MKKAISCQDNAVRLVTTFNLASATLIIPHAPAQALQFNFTYTPETRQEIIDGFEQAGNIWSSKLKDTYLDPTCYCETNTTININVNFGELSNPNALGGARPGMVRVNYHDYLTKAFQDITSKDDFLAFQNLQIDSKNQANFKTILQGKTLEQGNFSDIDILNRNLMKLQGSQFSMVANTSNSVIFQKTQKLKNVDSSTLIDNNSNHNNQKIWLTSANAKALNLIPGNNSGFDAQIIINNSLLSNTGDFIQDSIWDFSRAYNPNLKEVNQDKYDFLSVALHEIGHALGFVSGVDAFDVLTMAATKNNQIIEDKDLAYVSPLDLFRHSDESKRNQIFDWSKGGNKYFSIDGGNTVLASFDGTNYQSSHWQAANNTNSALGIMNPVLTKGGVLNISALDLQSLDVIGWDLNSKFADQTGLNLRTDNINGDITSKVKVLGLDWNNLTNLLTKPADTLLKELAQERDGIVPDLLPRLQSEYNASKTQLDAELAALKVLQQQKQAELTPQQTELTNLQKQQSDLQKQQSLLESSLQSTQDSLDKEQANLKRANKHSDIASITAKINSLQSERDRLQAQIQANQNQQQSLNSQIQTKQAIVNDLQKQLNNLQTTPSINSLQVVVSNLDKKLQLLKQPVNSDGALGQSNLAKLAAQLSSNAANVNAQLLQLKSALDSKLSKLTSTSQRAQEQQKTLDQIIKLAQEQEKIWQTVIDNHEFAVFSELDAQVRAWLQGSPEELKTHMENATLRQTAKLLEIAQNADAAQRREWQRKLIQAVMQLNNVNESTAKKLLVKAGKQLPKMLEDSAFDNYLSRVRISSTSIGIRYWQVMNNQNIEASQPSDTQNAASGIVENASLNILFNVEHDHDEAYEQVASVPEPNALAGLSTIGLWGIGWLFQRRRKSAND